MYRFDWDNAKDRSNRRKHGMSFEEACLAFDDPHCVFIQDRVEHGEVRWQALGRVNLTLIVLVAHVIFDDTDDEIVGVERIRIISARAASRSEREFYEAENRLV